MTAFATKTIQQIRGLILLGGFVLLVIPFALILSGTDFIRHCFHRDTYWHWIVCRWYYLEKDIVDKN